MSKNHQSDAILYLDSCMPVCRNKLLEFVKGLANHYFKKKEEIVSRTRLSGRRAGQQSKSEMAYTPQHVANFFLEKAESENVPLSQLKLIKLVYIAYGWYLALKNAKLFNEQIEAWKHGPVIPSIYHEFKDYGQNPIDRFAYELDLDTYEAVIPKIPADDEETRLILTKVWAAYKKFTGWTLRNKTHEPDSPWSRVYKEGQRGIRIKDEDIREHFTRKITGYLEAARDF